MHLPPAGSKGVQGVNKSSTEADIIILATETVAMSWARDASSLLLAVVMTGIGRLLYIPPLEWIGAVFFIMSFAASTSALRNRYRKTPQQAADYLRDRYGVFTENAETP
jgi:hypothetical protein